MMHKLLTTREKIIFISTIGVLIFSLVFNLFISPIVNKSEILNKDIQRTRAKLKKYRQLLSQKEQLQKMFSDFFPSLKAASRQGDAVESTLFDLENLAKEAGIRIVNIRPNASKGSDLFQETLIDLKTEGTSDGYLKFIYNIENSPSLFKIKTLQLTSRPNAQVLEGAFLISQLSVLE